MLKQRLFRKRRLYNKVICVNLRIKLVVHCFFLQVCTWWPSELMRLKSYPNYLHNYNTVNISPASLHLLVCYSRFHWLERDATFYCNTLESQKPSKTESWHFKASRLFSALFFFIPIKKKEKTTTRKKKKKKNQWFLATIHFTCQMTVCITLFELQPWLFCISSKKRKIIFIFLHFA